MRISGSCVIEGYGYMGAIHARISASLGLDTYCISRRKDVPHTCFESAEQALNDAKPDYWVICNQTGEHKGSLDRLASMGYRGRVLVEKPLCLSAGEMRGKYPFPVFVGYNMRFMPAIERLQSLVDGAELSGARFSVGGHLSGWRPGRDYSKTYSCMRMLGGGVLRDLSHELDLALTLCGKPGKIFAMTGNWSLEGMDCESSADILLESSNCHSVNIHLDCYDRNPHRIIAMSTPDKSITVNMISGMLILNGQAEQHDRDYGKSFQKQMVAFTSCDDGRLCNFNEGMDVMRFIERIEDSTAGQQLLSYECPN